MGQSDDSYIRKAAVKYRVPYVTTLTAALAAAEGVAARRKGRQVVRSLQAYHPAASGSPQNEARESRSGRAHTSGRPRVQMLPQPRQAPSQQNVQSCSFGRPMAATRSSSRWYFSVVRFSLRHMRSTMA